MGQLNEAIQVKNVLDFYNIDNFVETGTGAAEVVRSISNIKSCLLYTSPSPRDPKTSRMPSSA